jgi:hypothetical protein
MSIYLSLAVALVGLVMFIVYNATPPPYPTKAEIGRLMFACGLLAFLLTIAGGHTLSFPH